MYEQSAVLQAIYALCRSAQTACLPACQEESRDSLGTRLLDPDGTSSEHRLQTSYGLITLARALLPAAAYLLLSGAARCSVRAGSFLLSSTLSEAR